MMVVNVIFFKGVFAPPKSMREEKGFVLPRDMEVESLIKW